MAVNFGVAFTLGDKTGSLSGSDFVDIYDRLRLSLRCTAKDSTRTAYMIYNTGGISPGDGTRFPAVALVFGADNSLGTISFKPGCHVPMEQYLVKLSSFGSSRTRKFIASDGQEYRWSWRVSRAEEWTCTNASGYFVASYSLKIPQEPQYYTSGCILSIDEAYPHLASDILASLIIMRHICLHNL